MVWVSSAWLHLSFPPFPACILQSKAVVALRQSNKFFTSQLLEERKLRVRVSFLPDTDHFNLTERLADKDYEITREIVEVAKGKA